MREETYFIEDECEREEIEVVFYGNERFEWWNDHYYFTCNVQEVKTGKVRKAVAYVSARDYESTDYDEILANPEEYSCYLEFEF